MSAADSARDFAAMVSQSVRSGEPIDFRAYEVMGGICDQVIADDADLLAVAAISRTALMAATELAGQDNELAYCFAVAGQNALAAIVAHLEGRTGMARETFTGGHEAAPMQ